MRLTSFFMFVSILLLSFSERICENANDKNLRYKSKYPMKLLKWAYTLRTFSQQIDYKYVLIRSGLNHFFDLSLAIAVYLCDGIHKRDFSNQL